MLWQKGQSGNPNGRPTGTRDAKSILAKEKAANIGVDPVEIMLKTCRDLWNRANYKPADSEERERLQLLACEVGSKAAPYTNPRLSSIDVNNTGAGDTHYHLHVHGEKFREIDDSKLGEMLDQHRQAARLAPPAVEIIPPERKSDPEPS